MSEDKDQYENDAIRLILLMLNYGSNFQFTNTNN